MPPSTPTSQPWLHSARVSWRTAAFICVAWSALLVITARSPLGAYLEASLASPVAFELRHLLGKDPQLTPRLRIYGVDDNTVFKIQSPALSGHEWAQVFSVLAKSEPSAVVIDGMLSQTDAYAGEFNAALAHLEERGTQVIVGAFFSPQKVLNREPLAYRSDYNLTALLSPAELARGVGSVEDRLPPLAEDHGWIAYGPNRRFNPYLSHIGHYVYEGDGLVAALIPVDQRLQEASTDQASGALQTSAVAHLSLYLAAKRRIEGAKLILDDTVVPIDPKGRIAVDFVPPLTLENSVIPLYSLLEKAAKNQASSKVQKGDIVFIIPQYYTGNTDFKQTPFGRVPGGFVIASMLNSVATQQWLKPVSGEGALIVAYSVLGMLLGLNLGVVTFWLGLIAVSATSFAASVWLFSFSSIIVPWLLPLLSLGCVAVSIFAEKTRQGEKKAQALRASLSGLVSPAELKSLLKRPEMVNFEPRERIVTLMFIDVVGFSLLAENILPRVAFDQLKRVLSSLGDSVHEFGGIIDKTLGDGLLCYFGYRFDHDRVIPDHAEQALKCAIKIQQDNLARNLDAARSGEAMHPLRIGINTASCYLGDLGSAGRLDFTVVGNGVNFAKRLEGACEMHTVLMGATTSDLVRGINLPAAGFQKRLIRIKHHSELVEAFEYDPFFSEPEKRAEALEGFRRYAKIDRIDQQWPVHDGGKVALTSNYGPGSLVNFSQGSLRVKLKQLLVAGTELVIQLDSKDGALGALLGGAGLGALDAEVRWGYAEGPDFIHGVLLSKISQEQAEALVQHLCDVAFSREGERRTLPGSFDGAA